jgi:opacity protein-like surface antigen
MKLISGLVLIFVAHSAAAQEADWRYRATFYGWFPGLTASVDTKVGTVEGEASASDALQNLDMAFMGTFAAQNNRLGFVADLLYTDLSSTQPTPFGALFGEATVNEKVTALSGYALYRVTQDPSFVFDIGAGFRTFDMNVDVDLTAGKNPATSQSLSANWTDPLIAARVYVPISEKWFLDGFADYGGSGSGNDTWQVYGGVGYAFNEKWSTQLGYRVMNISKEVDNREVSLDLSGALFAFTYSF